MAPSRSSAAMKCWGFTASRDHLFRARLQEEEKRLALLRRQTEAASRRERESVRRELVRLQVRTPRCRLTSPVPVMRVSGAWLPPAGTLPTFPTPDGGTVSVLPSDSPYVAAMLRRTQASSDGGGTVAEPWGASTACRPLRRKRQTPEAHLITELKEVDNEDDDSQCDEASDAGSDHSDAEEQRKQSSSCNTKRARGSRLRDCQLPSVSSHGNSRETGDDSSSTASVRPSPFAGASKNREVIRRFEALLSPRPVQGQREEPTARIKTSVSLPTRLDSCPGIVPAGMEVLNFSTPVIVVKGNKAVTLNAKRMKLPREVTLKTGDSHRIQRATQIDAVLRRIASSRQDRFSSRYVNYSPQSKDSKDHPSKARPWTSDGKFLNQAERRFSQRVIWHQGNYILLKEVKGC